MIVASILLLVSSSAGAVWYVADRDHRHLEEVLRDKAIQNRSQQIDREVNLALDDAERYLHEIRSQLRDPCKTAVWLSELDLWQVPWIKCGKRSNAPNLRFWGIEMYCNHRRILDWNS